MNANQINNVVLFIVLIWTVSLLVVPFAVPGGRLVELSGSSWAIDNYDQFSVLPAYPQVIYLIGDLTCHQIAERSYHLNNNQMAVCSRCFAIYLGIVIGMLLSIIMKIKLTGKCIVFVLFSVVPLGIDGTGQLLGYWVSTNILRILTGLLAGMGVGIALAVSIVEMQRIILIIKEDLYSD